MNKDRTNPDWQGGFRSALAGVGQRFRPPEPIRSAGELVGEKDALFHRSQNTLGTTTSRFTFGSLADCPTIRRVARTIVEGVAKALRRGERERAPGWKEVPGSGHGPALYQNLKKLHHTMLTSQEEQRNRGEILVSLRRVTVLALCCGMQACALHPALQQSAVQATASPHRISLPETHRFSIAKEQDVVGSLMTLQLKDGDSLPDVARHYGLGYEEIAAANPGIDPWVPKSGSSALVPAQFVLPRAPRKGLVINLAAMRLFHFRASAGDTEVVTYPIGIGKEDRSTPTGPLSIVRKKERPIWYPTEKIRNDHLRKGDPLPAAVLPGPDNPLGEFALYLSRPFYLIHGTNKPYSVGWRASNGCLRLYPENIEQLFPAVPVKEPVLIVNQPYLVGWREGFVYLQAYRPQVEVSDRALQKRVRSELKKLEAERDYPLDWTRIDRVLTEARGIPTPISATAPGIDAVLARAQPLQHPRHFFGAPETPDAVPKKWNILVDETVSESMARRLAAFLNHQGPPIPARTASKGERYQVIAGPYETTKAAKAAVRRLQIEMELDGRIVAPTTEVAGSRPRGNRIKDPPVSLPETTRSVQTALRSKRAEDPEQPETRPRKYAVKTAFQRKTAESEKNAEDDKVEKPKSAAAVPRRG